MEGYWSQKPGEHAPDSEQLRDARRDAARTRLRESKNQSEACEAIREIVSNLLGCEEMALFELDTKRARVSQLWSFGLDPKFCLPNTISTSVWLKVIAGETQISSSTDSARHETLPTAIVPIQTTGDTALVLVLLRLLPQKKQIDEVDRELLMLISREAGVPLRGEARREPKGEQ